MNSQSLRQRRRRVALDQNQSVAAPQTESVATSAREPENKSVGTRPYSQAAKRSRQLKTTDLIPKRWWSLAGLFVALAMVVGLLNVVQHYSPGLVSQIGEQGVAALSLEGHRGIGAWYCNFMLILTSCASLQLYLLRQHRRDDYRGAYRIWLWVAGLCLLASVVTVTNLPHLLGNLWMNTTGVAGGSGWIVCLKLAALSLLFVRGIIEVRHSRLALWGLIVVFCAYGLAALIHEVPEYQSRAAGYIQAAEGNLLLIGSTLLLFTVITYARFVYLEANGLTSLVEQRSEAKRRNREGSSEARRFWQLRRRNENAESIDKKKTDGESVARKRAETRKRKTKVDATEASEIEKPVRSKETQNRPRATQPKTGRDNKTGSNSGGPAKKKKQKTTGNPGTESKTIRTTAKKQPRPMSDADESVAAIDEESGLSKSERRRRRKLKRREQRRAA